MLRRVVLSLLPAFFLVGLHQISTLFGAVPPPRAGSPSALDLDPNVFLTRKLSVMRILGGPSRYPSPPYQIMPHPDADPYELLISEEVVDALARHPYIDSDLLTFLLVQENFSLPIPEYWQGEIANIEEIPGGFKVEVMSRPKLPSTYATSLRTSETYSIVNGRATLEVPPTLDRSMPVVTSAN
jgi:hypothetical protein